MSENNQKCIGAEEHQSDILVHPKGVCMHGHHIWQVRISIICWSSIREAMLCGMQVNVIG